jgi:hypothetical protein
MWENAIAYAQPYASVCPIVDRIHVATFYVDNGKASSDYNLENCQHAARPFTAQPTPSPYLDTFDVKYRCEQGRFRQ